MMMKLNDEERRNWRTGIPLKINVEPDLKA